MQKKDNSISILSSSLAGFIARLICHPVDTLKANFQYNSSSSNLKDIILRITKEKGVFGLYDGLGASLIGGIPGTCLYIMSYEYFKSKNSTISMLREYTFLNYFFSGLAAETLCCTVFVPVDVIKERLQVQAGFQNKLGYKYNGPYDAISTIIKSEGLKGLYKGYFATLLSYGPFSALYFLFYEQFKIFLKLSKLDELSTLQSLSDETQLNFHSNLFCSAMAGGLSSFITNPLDMAKLRIQVQSAYVKKSTSFNPNSIIHILTSVYKEFGIRGLYRGALTRVLYHTPNTAITMAIFEELKKIES